LGEDLSAPRPALTF